MLKASLKQIFFLVNFKLLDNNDYEFINEFDRLLIQYDIQFRNLRLDIINDDQTLEAMMPTNIVMYNI